MPPEISGCGKKEQVVQKHVQFEVKAMPDGKLRALKMSLVDQETDGQGSDPADASLELDEGLVDQMGRFVADDGGGCDFAKFSIRFPKANRQLLQLHFDIIPQSKGRSRIELPHGHPLRSDEVLPDKNPSEEMPPPEEAEAEEFEEAKEEEQDQDQDEAERQDAEAMNEESGGRPEVAPDEPSIPLGLGCQPVGVIRNYDPLKGFGFIRCEGLPEDVFFPRSALPTTFQCKTREEMPELVGVQVSLDFTESSSNGRGPRTEKVNLNLMYLTEDRCWVLKRGPVPPKA
ncbi:unnamed protein product [Polarella glacialis]|uniref:CSD domain-containing protein n=2 Tax=Polarella glacialis TaxID=89957 RepID=A0A813ECF5_POLGL|nr:unnamed protein product [Polarella glacialis]